MMSLFPALTAEHVLMSARLAGVLIFRTKPNVNHPLDLGTGIHVCPHYLPGMQQDIIQGIQRPRESDNGLCISLNISLINMTRESCVSDVAGALKVVLSTLIYVKYAIL